MRHHSFNCPHCNNPISTTKAKGGAGAAPLGAFSFGAANLSLPSIRHHEKPIEPLTFEHIAMAVVIASFVTLGTSFTIWTLCQYAGNCLPMYKGLLSLPIAFGSAFFLSLRFIDSGRYERKQEPVSDAQTAKAPTVAQQQTPQIMRVEVSEHKSASSRRLYWFDLPTGIDDKLMRKVALRLKLQGWQWSRPRLVPHTISRHRFDQIKELLEENDLIIVDTRKSELRAAGRQMFKQFLEQEEVDHVG